MPHVVYQLQQFMGCVDGRPSWSKVFGVPVWGREDALKKIEELLREHPGHKYRVRKITRK